MTQKWGRLAPKWDKSEAFSDQIPVHFGSLSEQISVRFGSVSKNVLKSYLKKSPFGVNLPQFGPKSGQLDFMSCYRCLGITLDN